MITALKVKRLVLIGKNVAILLEDGTVLVEHNEDFVDRSTGEVYLPVADLYSNVLGFIREF